MSTTEHVRRASLLVVICAAMGVTLLSVQPAQADTLQECQQKLMSGQITLDEYLVCISGGTTTTTSGGPTSSVNTGSQGASAGRTVSPVSSSTTSGSLPTTGSSSGRFVGAGAALIVLGGAALYGATRNRKTAVASPETQPSGGSDD